MGTQRRVHLLGLIRQYTTLLNEIVESTPYKVERAAWCRSAIDHILLDSGWEDDTELASSIRELRTLMLQVLDVPEPPCPKCKGTGLIEVSFEVSPDGLLMCDCNPEKWKPLGEPQPEPPQEF